MPKKLDEIDKIIKILEDEIIDDLMLNLDKIKEVVLFIDEKLNTLEMTKNKSIEELYMLSD